MDILDNINVIKQRDPDNALRIVSETPEQLLWDAVVENDPAVDHQFRPSKIILAGMGGSALAGLIVKNWLNLSIPFDVIRDYDLPQYIDEGTLVIAASYSGNTEETLSSFDQAINKKARVVVIASGGKLIDSANKLDIPFVKLPVGLQPRMATFYGLRAITKILSLFNVAPESYSQIADCYHVAKSYAQNFLANIGIDENLAKQIAIKCVGKTPVIYSSTLMSPVSYKWKISFNENAKNTSFYNQLPEFNHNEFMGWVSHPIKKPFIPINLLSSFDHSLIKKRFEISDQLLSGKRPASFQVNLHGDTVLCQMICGSILADFVTIYLAILNNVNPIPVPLIEQLKIRLS